MLGLSLLYGRCGTTCEFGTNRFRVWAPVQNVVKVYGCEIQITCSRLSDSGGLFTISDFSILEPETGYNPHSYSAIQTALASRKPGSHVIQYVSKRKKLTSKLVSGAVRWSKQRPKGRCYGNKKLSNITVNRLSCTVLHTLEETGLDGSEPRTVNLLLSDFLDAELIC